MSMWPWLIAAVFLYAYEMYALEKGKPSLSHMMWVANKSWPFFGVLVGMVIGGLMVHFFWIPAWCGSMPVEGGF